MERLLSGAVGSVSRVNRLCLALLGALLVALGGASAVRGEGDPQQCFGVPETIVGTPGNDVITGTPGNDVINAGAGDDTIDGGGGNDVICGGDGNDTIVGGPGQDALSGDAGNDSLDGGPGLDLAVFYWSPTGVNASLATNTATGWGTDTLANFEGLVGSNLGDDTLTGDAHDNLLDGRGGNDVLLGGQGSDVLDGDAGNDVLDGGPGTDLVFYDYSPYAVVANLATHVARGWGTDTLRSVEDLHGSMLSDVLIGNGGPNLLNGHNGNDRIVGGGGSDLIYGEQGNDQLLGGPGRDFLKGGPGKDVVDGGPGRDKCLGERKRRCP
jgi:Ca2+-binding RTX toxin-like protein